MSVVIGGSASASASANLSVVIGQDANASLGNGTAVGNAAHSTGNNAVAIGTNTTGSGASATCVGPASAAIGDHSVAVGQGATTGTGTTNSIAIGLSATTNTNATDSIAIGQTSSISASATSAIALGANSTGGGTSSIAIGPSANASVATAVALGAVATASGTAAIAIGTNSTASATDAIAIGNATNNSTANSCLIGDSAITNIRPNNIACDLGTSAAHYKTVWLKEGATGMSTHFAMPNTVSYTNLTAATSLTTGTAFGNLVVGAGLTGNTFIRFKFGFAVSSLTTDTITLAVTEGKNTIMSVALTNASGFSNTAGMGEITLANQATNSAGSHLNSVMSAQASGQSPSMAFIQPMRMIAPFHIHLT